MTIVDAPSDLARRLERFRSARASGGSPDGPLPHRPLGSADLAARLADTLDGEVVIGSAGRYVRVDGPATEVPVDRRRLATLPGQPPPDRPLVCLDTETTGLATAAGTVAFCIGLGWWAGTTFRQAQLLLPDHADEQALLDALAAHIPPDAWLVTYNGRGFDWPLLVTRYRLARRAAPVHDGHLDLLPIVRRLFRYRMADARLRTAEGELLGLTRHDDVDGWEIPERYLGFLRGGPAQALAAVVRHNDTDVRSLALLLLLLERRYATPEARRTAPAGDLAGLARAFLRARHPDAALACLEEALGRADDPGPAGTPARPPRAAGSPVAAAQTPTAAAEVPWWAPAARPDFGGRPRPRTRDWPGHASAAFSAGWDQQRMAVDRAHLLRRLGRFAEAEAAWVGVAGGPGRATIVGWIEVAKLREHRFADPDGALTAALRGLAAAERRRRLGLPEPGLEADLRHRLARLRRRTRSGGRDGADLLGRRRDDEPADPLAQRPVAHGRQIRHARQADALHGQ